MKPYFRLQIAHKSTHNKQNVLLCKYIRYSGMQNDTFYVSTLLLIVSFSDTFV
jgi:hypothetical protein